MLNIFLFPKIILIIIKNMKNHDRDGSIFNQRQSSLRLHSSSTF